MRGAGSRDCLAGQAECQHATSVHLQTSHIGARGPALGCWSAPVGQRKQPGLEPLASALRASSSGPRTRGLLSGLVFPWQYSHCSSPVPPAASRRLSCPGFAVELTWCFGVCSLPWLSFLSRFAGINLHDPSVGKRRTTRLSGPSQACTVAGWAGKRCLCLCARLLPQFLDPIALSPRHSHR